MTDLHLLYFNRNYFICSCIIFVIVITWLISCFSQYVIEILKLNDVITF